MKKYTLLLSSLVTLNMHAQDVKWMKSYPPQGQNSSQTALAVSNNENIAFAGISYSYGSQHGGYMYKTDSTGTVLWGDNLMLSNPQYNYGDLSVPALAFDAGENLFMAVNFRDTLQFGSSSYPSAGMDRTILVKYNSSGSKDFLMYWDNATINGLCRDNAGNMTVLMSFEGTISFFGQTFTTTTRDLLVLGLSPSNTVVFSKQIHGGYVNGTKVKVSQLGNYVVLGNFSDSLHYDGIGHSWSHDGSPDAFVMKISSTGIVIGYATAMASIMDYEDDVVVSAGDSVAVSGHGSWTYNAWADLRTYDQLMNQVYSGTISDDEYASVHDLTSLAVVDNGGFWGVGFTRDANMGGDPNDDEYFLHLYKIDMMGNIIMQDSFATFQYFDRHVKQIAAGKHGNFYVTGPFKGNFTMGSETVTEGSSNEGIFLTKLNEALDVTTGIAENSTNEFSIYPNPSVGEIIVKADVASELRIFDVAGKLVMTKKLASGSEKISTGLQAGVYTAELSSAKGKQQSRLVIVR